MGARAYSRPMIFARTSAWLCVGLLGLGPSGAASPAPAGGHGAGTYRLGFRVSSHHGCSRSYATLWLDGSATLTLRGGRAVFTVDYVSDNRIGAQGWQFGPSGPPGRRGSPIRVTQTRTRWRVAWSGPARRGAGGAVTLSLGKQSELCERLPAHGLAGGVRVGCWGLEPMTLTCREAAVHARRAGAGSPDSAGTPLRSPPGSAAARPAPASLVLVPTLQCQAPRWPGYLDSLLHGGSLYLAPGAALRMRKSQRPGWLRSFEVGFER